MAAMQKSKVIVALDYPVDAIKNGSDYLVMGRPVTRADDPEGVLRTINSDLSALTLPS